jgi:hypothetical protein
MGRGESVMGEEDKEWTVWLDEYTKDMGNISIDIDVSDYDYISNNVANFDDWIYNDPNIHNDITLTGGGEEMLRVAEDGFYVRGVKVPADAKEAEQVYRAFKQWLAWAVLSKNET